MYLYIKITGGKVFILNNRDRRKYSINTWDYFMLETMHGKIRTYLLRIIFYFSKVW